MRTATNTVKWALALSAAAALAAPGAQAQNSLAIGVHASFSGAAAAFAEGMLAATELAAEDVNKDGGLQVAGRRYKVGITQYDDRYKAQDAVTAMDRLISQDGIRFVVGPLGSAAAVATKPQTTANKVITMTLGFTPRALGADAPYAFRTVITTGEFSEPQVAWLLKTVSAKRVISLLPNDETGQQMGAGNTAAYAKAGSKLQVDYFERERVDFVPTLSRILVNSDALEIGGAAPTTAGLILKQARELGYKGPVFVTGGDVTAELVKVAGKQAAEGAYVHLPIDTEPAGDRRLHRPLQGQIRSEHERLQPVLLFGPPDAVRRHAESRHRRGHHEDCRHACGSKRLPDRAWQGELDRQGAIRHRPSDQSAVLRRTDPRRGGGEGRHLRFRGCR